MLPPTRTEKTCDAYAKVVQGIIRRGRAAGIECPVMYLDSIKATLSFATFRQYKAAITYVFESRGQDATALEVLRWTKPSDPLPKRTSAQKRKSLPRAHLDRIVAELEARGSRNCLLASQWLQANLIVGLRPIEWPGARLEGDVFTVLNAKTTNDRSHGDSRSMVLTINDQERELLTRWLETVATMADDWNRTYEAVRRRLYVVVRHLFGKGAKHITLYSPRHQFAADQKAAGSSKAAVAATMGHRKTGTAVRHYGRKRSGVAANARAKPAEADLKRVMAFNPEPAPQPAPQPATTQPTLAPMKPTLG